MHLEYELQEKNIREQYLSTTLMTQQQQIDELQEEKNKLLEEVTHLQSKLQSKNALVLYVSSCVVF
jgi:peptidoglycan hydrolase CwlO-like protein